MSLPIFGAQAAVSILNRVFTNSSPANAVFANQVTNATASLAAGANSTDVLSYTAFAKSFGTAYATQTPAALSTLMLSNMGLLPNAALQTALADYITAAGVANVGIVALQLSNILSAIPTTDVNYGAAARAWDAEVTSAFTYSSNTANTTQQSGDVVQPPANQGQTFTLTTGEDSGASFTGTSGNDSFNASVVLDGAGAAKDTLNAFDSLNGGAGTDTLSATINGGAVVAPFMTNIENVTVRLTSAGSGIDLTNASGVTNLTFNASSNAGGTNVVAAATGVSITNQKTDVTADKSTATTLALNFDAAGVVSTTAPTVVTLDLGKTTASKATTMNITTNNSNVKVDSTSADIATTVTVAATGANTLNLVDVAGTATSLSVTGAGTVDMSGTAFTKVATVTGADGGLKLDMTGNSATALSVTTGAGVDTLTATGANLTTLNSGAGNDVVTITSALGATSTVTLGDGDDSVTLNAAPTAGATIAGGAGKDTIGLTKADFGTVSAFSATNLAKISGFEVLSITDALANGATYDASKITDATGFTAAAGVVGAGAATVSNLAANATVTIAGANTATVESDTIVKGAASNAGATKWEAGDVVTITVAGTAVTYTVLAADVAADDTVLFTSIKAALDANATVAAAVSVAVTDKNTLTLTGKHPGTNFTLTAGITDKVGGTAGTDTLTVTETAPIAAGSLSATMKTDTAADVMTLVLNNNYTENNDATATVTNLTNTVTTANVETLNVTSSGKGSVTFTGLAGNKADGVNNTLALTNDQLVTLNVTGTQAFTFNTANSQTKLATIDASALTAGATISAAATTTATNAAITMKGSATAANTLTGSSNADTIIGGSKNDTITGGGKGDTLTGNGGNDKFVFAAGDSVIGTGTFDTITDFLANTYGQGANGAVTVAGATTDSTKINGDVLQIAKTGTGAGGILFSVLSNAADASTYLATNKAANTVVAALDSSTGALYIDNVGADGVADLYIKLTGVTSLDAAAFVLV